MKAKSKKRNLWLNLFLSPLLLASLTSCQEEAITDDPVSALNGLVKEYGFIGYENPLENSKSGTMLAGRPNALAYIAPPESCFSEEQIPRTVDKQHFNKKYNYSFQGNFGFTVFGTALFSAGLGINKTHNVNVELNGITIEYMSSIDITDWYNSGMSQTCKNYLDDVGFVIQALSTDSMKISIEKIGGTNVGLSAENISQFFNFEIGVDWKIIDSYTVEISTPKYIGYQLGRLRLEDDGRVLYRAMVAEGDKFVFEPISLFADTAPAQDQKQQVPSELDKNAIYKE